MRLFSIAASLLLAFSAVLCLAQEPDQQSAPKSSSHDYSQEGFVVEQLRVSYRFENDGTGRRELYSRVKVQSEAGVRQFGQLTFGYSAVNERVEIAYVRVLKADGSKVTAPPESVQDLSPPITKEAPVYTDFREKHITVPGLRPGEVLEYNIVAVQHTPLAPNEFWMQHEFGKWGIILDEQLELNIPADRKIKLKTKPGADPIMREDHGRRIYSWKSSNLEREDDDSKKDKKKKRIKSQPEPPSVQMTTFSSWEEVGSWYAALEKDRRQPSYEIKTKAAALTSGKAADLDKVEALYDFVAKNFRYVSLSFGVGRYQPHAAEDVLHNQYGDCKDKHTLLSSMLESNGMHPSSVLINSFRKLDPDVPSPSQFDHIITLLPLGKEEIWMDTTTEVAPFRFLSFNLRKKQALVIPAVGAAHLQETLADPPMPDTDLAQVEGKVDDAGKLVAKVHINGSGDSDLVMRTVYRQVPNSQWKRLTEMISSAAGAKGEVDDLGPLDPTDTHKQFDLSYKITDKDFLDWTQKKLDVALPLARSNLPDVDFDDNPDAEPIKLGAPGEHVYRVRLELPAKYSVRIPVSFSIKRDYGEYQAAYKLEGNIVTAERRLLIRERELPADRGRDYQAFRKAVAADASQELSLESSVAGKEIPLGLGADDLSASGYQAMQNGNYTLAVDLLEGATKADSKHKFAWNNLGLAYAYLGKTQQAIAAYQKQIEVNPYDEYAYNNLGRAYRQQHRYPDAENSFKKQIEVNPLDKYAHDNLGSLYLDWKKYDDAVAELEKARSLTPNNPELNVELGTAYLNLGQNDKAQQVFEKAVELAPRPIVWNNIAYQLAEKNARLDLAQQYAESAIAATAAASRNITLEQVGHRDLDIAYSLLSYWDTLGWVYFAKGNLDKSQKYIQAAWLNTGRSDVGKHLGEIYEKLGQRELAIQTYATAATALYPEPEATEKLITLSGMKDVSSLLDKNREKLQQIRTIHLGKIAKVAGSADFLILLGASGAESVKFVSGETRLKELEEALRNAKYGLSFPEDTPAKLIRRGTLTCSAKDDTCDFVLLFPDDVHSID